MKYLFVFVIIHTLFTSIKAAATLCPTMNSGEIISFANWTRKFFVSLEEIRVFNPRKLHPIKPRTFSTDVWKIIKDYAGIYDLPVLWDRKLQYFRRAVIKTVEMTTEIQKFPRDLVGIKKFFWKSVKNNPSKKYEFLQSMMFHLLPSKEEILLRDSFFHPLDYPVGSNVLFKYKYYDSRYLQNMLFGKIIKCTPKTLIFQYYISERVNIPNDYRKRYIRTDIMLTGLNNEPIVKKLSMKEFITNSSDFKFYMEGHKKYSNEFTI